VKASPSPPSTPPLVTYEQRLETLTFSLPFLEEKRRRRAREVTRGVGHTEGLRTGEREREREASTNVAFISRGG